MADIAKKFGLGSSGPYAGTQAPKQQAGKLLLPPHCTYNNATMSATSGRYYAVPFPVVVATTFAGAKFYNSGTGDSGNKVKIAMYSEATGGGLGAVAKNFGEATLTSSAAINALASSWSATPAMYWLVFVANAAVAVATMGAMARGTSAGYITGSQTTLLNSIFPADLLGVAGNSGGYVGDYVAGTYANFPEANGLTLTNSVLGLDVPASTGVFPLVGLYT